MKPRIENFVHETMYLLVVLTFANVPPPPKPPQVSTFWDACAGPRLRRHAGQHRQRDLPGILNGCDGGIEGDEGQGPQGRRHLDRRPG